MLCFARDKDEVPAEWKNKTADAKTVMLEKWGQLKEKYGDDFESVQTEYRRFVKASKEVLNPITHYDRVDNDGPYTGGRKVHNPRPGGHKYDVFHPVTKKACEPPANGYRYPPATMDQLLKDGRILFGEDDSQIIQIKEYLKDYEGKLSSVIHLDSRTGANDLKALFPEEEKLFTNPKPVTLLTELFDFVLEGSDLVLDFFSGSCSTPQTVLEMNRKDGGNRKFIVVQLPEPTGNKDYPTIAEIGKERIRRVLAKLKKEAAESLKDESAQSSDLGFKVFKLAAPHIQPWSAGDADREPEKYAAKLAMYNDPLMPGWTAENVLWEIALREGFGLNTRFEEKKLKKGNTIWLATDPDKDPPQTLIVCLDDKIAVDFSKHVELTPEQIVVARDLALDDTAAANLALQCRLKTI